MSGAKRKINKQLGNDGSRIVVPGGRHHEVFRFHNTNPPKCVVEVPRTLYNGVSVCLATDDAGDMNRLKYLANRFEQFWLEVARKMGTEITV
jgi:hypothetical protein